MADLLFLTPLLPYPTGTGSAMRASVAMDLLAERHRVFVVNAALWGSLPVFDESWVRKRAAGYTLISPQPDAAAIDHLARERFPDAKFDGLYVFRLCMAPVALQVLARLNGRKRIAALDLDDDELARSERFGTLREEAGDHNRAALERAEIRRLEMYYKMFLPRFQVLLLAAPEDRDALAKRFPGLHFAHLCNVVREPACVERNPDPGRLLFVGNLSYLPNEDAIVYFCNSVLPLLKASGGFSSVRIVGAGATPRLHEAAWSSGAHVTGPVPDLAPEYARAAAAIVPLRAGSGTRIKILEAISYRCPVVSTSIGAEGLSLRHEEQILIADTPAEFAAACVRLMTDPALRSRLVEKAFTWLRERHTLEHARATLHSIYG